ncbi:MAG: squalene/phytoene synthase family protein [Burkholderiales bacterium]|nr:squalene/phytoene synthase family protein [Burkholderiales bacterium]
MNSSRPTLPVSTHRHPLPPVGSSLYYTLQMVPSSRRAALRDWWQWWHEVSSIPFDVQDPGVAETKLRWWIQEVQAGAQGQPTHPLTQALMPPTTAQNDTAKAPLAGELPLWLNQIEGLITLIHQTRWLDAAALQHHRNQTTAAATEAAAVLLGATTPAARQAARQLGLGCRQTHQLARLGQDARAGWVHVPVDVLQKHEVRAHELTKPAPKSGEHWPALLTYLCDQAQAQLLGGLTAIRALSRPERRALRPLVALAQMQLALLDEIRASEDRVLHERLLLTPVRKWWISAKVRLGLLH